MSGRQLHGVLRALSGIFQGTVVLSDQQQLGHLRCVALEEFPRMVRPEATTRPREDHEEMGVDDDNDNEFFVSYMSDCLL